MNAYIYRNVITFDEQLIDDYIFIELSKYKNGYPNDESIAEEFERNVEQEELDIQGLLDYIKQGYKLIEQGGTDV